MTVELLITEERFGIKEGQIFSAEKYSLDPGKVTLKQRLNKDGKPIGKPVMCNEYLHNVRIIED
ncbi:uncharacterized protein CHSO_1075 [Chryseobacterium sp. StRB126]|uniref:hypothetical protein n=1 Tax=Chryseobacterium sp. StRB126 TaxID=878220 RepID=UPI0004E98901|nr:hypothetical protein [Chryseobacterium sp. StRB126]BAP30112.1 uncharacterized protein CHSO_1075 [Chryseobacterium sp. StRB126]